METIISVAIVLIIGTCFYYQCKKRKLSYDSEGFIAAPSGFIETSILPLKTNIDVSYPQSSPIYHPPILLDQ